MMRPYCCLKLPEGYEGLDEDQTEIQEAKDLPDGGLAEAERLRV